jgi:hypothetical protein
MLKLDAIALHHLEKSYPGIGETIHFFETEVLPACPHCCSVDTASVQCGVIGRTISLAGATTKFKLIANGPKPGSYFCNVCEKFFE